MKTKICKIPLDDRTFPAGTVVEIVRQIDDDIFECRRLTAPHNVTVLLHSYCFAS